MEEYCHGSHWVACLTNGDLIIEDEKAAMLSAAASAASTRLAQRKQGIIAWLLQEKQGIKFFIQY